ncbi:Eco57I restriction-modification methylase domain-containing protein [Fusibacter ferrireducens]|uniref:site-specific DNA-methyltransferase (adenine-specific) n=1 Tax=Fusibacter ferrireducens TaxID=2785058 RepID=A0ABR9ZWR4_9FIRM|nr:Eco57I restriction-modification methylase domain-containing protein [Fusibacter ferrireducens]MBF4694900.1 Eco57I restriction-modification methylase domain-containing protein [Fusibacter ferrireducens]
MFVNYTEAKSSILHERVVIGIDSGYTRGTVYTPEKISKYMVYLLIKDYMCRQGAWSAQREALLKKVYLEHTIEKSDSKAKCRFDFEALSELRAILKFLKPLTILDLSCGTGLLLLAYLELHIQLMIFLEMSKKEMAGHLQTLIEDQLYAYDINEAATDYFKTTLEILMTCLDEAYSLKSNHIRNGNSLISTDNVKVDLIIGNPPYIGEKGNLDLFEVIKASNFGRQYYEGKMDYFYFFIYKAYECLKRNGSLCYLTSNYFLTADGAMKLRNFIKEQFNISQMLDFNDEKIFKEKKLHACIYTLTPIPQHEIACLDANLNLKATIKSSEVYFNSKTFHFISDAIVAQMLTKMKKNFSAHLGDYFEVKQGIVSGADRCNGLPVFVYKTSELAAIPQVLLADIKPFFKNSSIKHFDHDVQTPFYILYTDKYFKQKEVVMPFLAPYKDKLMLRREVKNGVRQWYELTWPREATMFEKPKVVVPQRAKSNYFAYSEGQFYASADVYYIFSKLEMTMDEITEMQLLKGLTAFLNSYIVLLYLYYKGKRKGEALELYATPLKLIPYEPSLLLGLAKFYDMKLPLAEKLDAINKILYEALNLSEEESTWLNKFGRKFL